MRFACLCCGFLTLSESPPGSYAICPVCFWEDDYAQGLDPFLAGGANVPNLVSARETFRRSGAVEERFVGNVRDPVPDEVPGDAGQCPSGDGPADL